VQVFDLRFTSRDSLLDGFRRAQDRSAVDSCTLEIEDLRMRFVAPRCEAEELAHRIYLDGGLCWCSGHELREVEPGCGEGSGDGGRGEGR
jgi:hypothetical protein